jgi:hypothetical protein
VPEIGASALLFGRCVMKASYLNSLKPSAKVY